MTLSLFFVLLAGCARIAISGEPDPGDELKKQKHDAEVRAQALAELGNLGNTVKSADANVRGAAVAATIKIFNEHVEPSVRNSATMVLSRVRPATPEVVAVLLQAALTSTGGKDLNVQQSGAAALREIGEPVVPALREALHSPDEDVRFRAARTLQSFGPLAASAVPELIACLKGEPLKNKDKLFSYIAETLSTIPAAAAKEAIPSLIELSCKFELNTAQYSAVQALRVLGSAKEATVATEKQVFDLCGKYVQAQRAALNPAIPLAERQALALFFAPAPDNDASGIVFKDYFYRCLAGQGPHAASGRKAYAKTGGFGMLAWPEKYGTSGLNTFMVNERGAIYRKDFGADTGTLVPKLTEFDPDESWTKVKDPDPLPPPTSPDEAVKQPRLDEGDF